MYTKRTFTFICLFVSVIYLQGRHVSVYGEQCLGTHAYIPNVKSSEMLTISVPKITITSFPTDSAFYIYIYIYIYMDGNVLRML